MLGSDFPGQLKQKKRINRKLTQAANANAAAVLKVVYEELSYMNGVNMATALHRIARHSVKGEAGPDAGASPEAKKEVEAHPAFESLLLAVERQAEGALYAQNSGRSDEAEEILPAQCASIMAWSLACLEICNDRLLSVLASLAVPGLENFKFYEVTNMLWAYAKLKAGSQSRRLVAALSERLRRRRPGEYKAHCLSSALWAFAELRWSDPALVDSLAEELRREANTLQPQEICNISWALAHGWHNSPVLLDTLRTALAGDVLRRFKPQEFLSFMLAITEGGVSLPGLFARCGASAVRLAKTMKPKHIASTLTACAAAGCQDCSDLVPRLLDVATEQIFHFLPHELVAVARAAALLCPGHPGFFKACASDVVSKLPELSVDNLTDLIDAFMKSKDTQASWALHYLVQEWRNRAPPKGPQSLSTASTTPERENSNDAESLNGSGSDEDGRVQPRVAWTHEPVSSEPKMVPTNASERRPLGEPWKVISMRPPPGLDEYAPRPQTFLADGVSLFTF